MTKSEVTKVTSRSYANILVLAASLSGCVHLQPAGDGGSGGDDGATTIDGGTGATLLSISIEPLDPVVTVENGAGGEVPFTTFAHWDDGTVTEVAMEDLTYSIDASELGSFPVAPPTHPGSIFVSGTERGGVSTVHTWALGYTAATSITVRLRWVVAGAGVPPGADTMFSGPPTTDPSRSPAFIYPYDGVLIPPNLPGFVPPAQIGFDFQWNGGNGNDLWRFTLLSDLSEVIVYSVSPVFEPEATLWSQIMETNRGSELTAVAEGVASAAPGEVGVSSAISVLVAEEDVLGGIYYWGLGGFGGSGGSNNGVYRFDFGWEGVAAGPFYTDANTPSGECVGCHTLSRDGTKMAFSLGPFGPFGAIDVGDPTALTYQGSSNFQVYNPDGTLLITNLNGALNLLDGTTGAPVGALPVTAATHPDWSPDGSSVAYTKGGGGFFDDLFVNPPAGIDVMPYLGGSTWGTPWTLVPTAGSSVNYYPAYSPDGVWIVYNKSAIGSYDAPDATVHLIAADGSSPSIPLTTANGSGMSTNSWPKWSPYVHDYHGTDLMWVTFSSRRSYGVRVTDGRSQIWMAAIDPMRAAAGLDPSYPPFWVPNQMIDTGNHIAQWTEVIIQQDCVIDEDCRSGEFCAIGKCWPIR